MKLRFFHAPLAVLTALTFFLTSCANSMGESVAGWRPGAGQLQQLAGYLAFIFVCLVALTALAVRLWKAKEKRDELVFTVSRESIGEQSEKIASQLQAMKASKREINTALLLLEEIVVRLHDQAKQAVTARIRKTLGEVSVVLSAYGQEYNPFEALDWNGRAEDVYRDMIFYAHQDALSYSRKSSRNVVTLRVHAAGSRMLYFTFGAMLLGICCGFIMKLLPPAAAVFLAQGVCGTVQTLFMNSLMLLVAPVVFFSMASSIVNLSGASVGRIGGKLAGIYFMTTVLAILLAFLLAALFFAGPVPSLPEILSEVPERLKRRADLSVSALLVGLVPDNLVSPVASGNMLQVLFVAVFTGLALRSLGDAVPTLRTLLNEANSLFLKMIGMIMPAMPLLALVSFALLVYGSSASSLLMLLTNIVALVLGAGAMFGLYGLVILIFGRRSPLPYFRKAGAFFLTPFTIASSSATIPLTLDFCKKKLGVSDSVASFSVPLGATVNMDGSCLCMVITVIMLARMCGLPLDAALLVKIGLMTFMLSVGAPAVPGSLVICFATMLPAIGVPVSALGFVAGLGPLLGRILTATNVMGDTAAAVVVSASEGQLDDGLYSA